MQIWPLVIRSRILYSKIFTKSNIFHEGKLVYPRASRHDIGQRRFCLFSGHKNSSYTATSSPIASPSFKGWMRGKSRCIRNMQGNNCNWFHRVWLLNENRCCAYTLDFNFARLHLSQIFYETYLSILLVPRFPSPSSKFFHVKEISIDATTIRPLLTFTSTSLLVIKFLIKGRGSPVCLISFFHFSRYPDFWKNYLILIYLIEFSLTDVTHKGRAIFMRFIIVEEKNWRNWVIIPTCIFRLWSGM